jgi:arginine deiminase
MSHFLNIYSETGPLEAVMLHRPGQELQRLTPKYLNELLFDDIPWLERMQQEHDQFADVLRDHGATVYYCEDMLTEILESLAIREALMKEALNSCDVRRPEDRDIVLQFIDNMQASEVAQILIAGLHKDQISPHLRHKNLSFYIKNELPFFISPIPNFYFSRDPGAVIGNGLSVNAMQTPARRRESMLLDYIFRYHPAFSSEEHPAWYGHDNPDSIEGGDILVLDRHVVAIGCSERTSAMGIEALAQNLFRGDEELREVLVIQIPFKRAFMHLDTVFTMVDVDKFTIYPGIENHVHIYRLTPSKDRQDIHISPLSDLTEALKASLHLPAVQLIQSGGSDHITSAREQWSDSTNTLALAPGVVVTYKRNIVSNHVLRANGITVIEIEGSELVRGRGGPRCMSMPLRRA